MGTWIAFATHWVQLLLLIGWHLALLVAAVGWQIVEYRRFWSDRRAAWWFTKFMTPVVLLGIFALIMGLFSHVTGMEALAVFYGAILAALIGTPILMPALLKLGGIPAGLSGIAVLSLLGTGWVGWFSGHGLAQGVKAITSTHYARFAKQQAFRAYKQAAQTAPSAEGVIWLETQQVMRLSGHQRLVHLAFHVEPTYQFHRVDIHLENSRDDKANWRSRSRGCVHDTTYHVTQLIDQADQISVRLVAHQGSPESMVAFEARYPFPPSDLVNQRLLIASFKDGYLSVPLPLPASWLFVQQPQAPPIPLTDLLRPEPWGSGDNSPSKRCLSEPVYIGAPPERVRLQVPAAEQRRSHWFSLYIQGRPVKAERDGKTG